MDQQLIDAIEKLVDRIDRMSGGAPSGFGRSFRPGSDPAQNVRSSIDSLKFHTESVKKSSQNFQGLDNILTRQNRQYVNNYQQLSELNKAYDEARKIVGKRERDQAVQQLDNQRRELRNATISKNVSAATVNFTNTLTSSVVTIASGVGSAMKELVSNIMGDQLGFRTAGAFLKSMIGIAVDVVKSVSSLVSGLGEALSKSFGKIGSVLGLALNGVGKAASTAASVLGQMSSVVIDVVVQTMESLSKTFFAASKAGGVFSGGMNDLAAMARRVGLPIEAMGKLITENNQALSQTGLGVAQATRTAVNILAGGGNQLRSSLFGLGFALDEHAGLVADAMSMMTAVGDPFRANTPDTVRATEDLAKNMRLMANYTGEDLKRKNEESAGMRRNLVFQQKLAQMDVTQRTQFQAKFNSLDKQMQQNIIDQMALGEGNVVNITGATMMATNPEYRRLVGAAYSNLMNQNVTLEDMYRNQASMEQDAARTAINDTAMGVLMALNKGGVGGDTARALGEMVEKYGRRNEQALNEAASNVKGAATPTGLTSDVMTANQAIMKMKSDLEQTSLGLAGKFTQLLEPITNLINAIAPYAIDAFKALTDVIIKLVPELAKIMQKTTPENIGKAGEAGKGGQGEVVGGYIGTALGALTGAMAGKSIGSMIGGAISLIPHPVAKVLGGLISAGSTLAGGLFGASEGKAAGETTGGFLEGISKMFGGGKADGGYLVPNKTYLVGEQGPELFRAGTTGTVMPNDFLRSLQSQLMMGANLTQPVGGVSKTDLLLTELKQVLKDQNQLTKQSLEIQMEQEEVMRDLRSINQQILHNNY